MDGWAKLDVASKVIAATLIPVAVTYLGNQVLQSTKQRESEAKFVELATAILGKEPGPKQSAEDKNLRKWAVDVVNRYSGVKMSEATADALIRTTALPQVSSGSTVPVGQDVAGTWGVVFGGDPTLEAATHEITKTAERIGIGPGEVFRRAGSFRSVKVYVSRSEAEDAVGKARLVRPSAYVVNMATWCPTSTANKGYYECAAP